MLTISHETPMDGRVLELRDLSLGSASSVEARAGLEVAAVVPRGHLLGVLGAMGSGKTALLETIAGLRPRVPGQVRWDGRDLAVDEAVAHEIGYLPTRSAFPRELTVLESVRSTFCLRARTTSRGERAEAVAAILQEAGLQVVAGVLVEQLSQPDRWRLALALELTARPHLLLCDEPVGGLDAGAEAALVTLLHDLSQRDDRLVVQATRSVHSILQYDSVLVMVGGLIAYHGEPENLPHYFDVESPEAVFARLSKRRPEQWHASWLKHREAYYRSSRMPLHVRQLSPSAPTVLLGSSRGATRPGLMSQAGTLLVRRWTQLLRSRAELGGKGLVLAAFSMIAAAFVPKEAVLTQSGWVLLVVVLGGLLGAHNGASEIAGERGLWEKEKWAGVRPEAYLVAKVLFLAVIVAVQTAGLLLIVGAWRWPGSGLLSGAVLAATNAASTSAALALSSWLRCGATARLAAVYWFGLQTLASGLLLPLPVGLASLLRPIDSVAWAWSGISMGKASPSVAILAIWVLIGHAAIGLAAAWVGCRKRCSA